MNLNSLFSKAGVSGNMTQDITLLAVIIIASLLFGLFIGRFKLVTVLINIYIAFALLATVPEKYLVDYNYRLIFFYAALVILTLAGRKLFEIYISSSGSGFMWRVFAMSFLEVVFLLSITLAILPKKIALGYVSPNAYQYLASADWRFVWMVVPLIFIFIIHKRLNR